MGLRIAMREGGAEPNDRARGETGRDGSRADHLYARIGDRDMMLLYWGRYNRDQYEVEVAQIVKRRKTVQVDDDAGHEGNVGHAGWRSIDACLGWSERIRPHDLRSCTAVEECMYACI